MGVVPVADKVFELGFGWIGQGDRKAREKVTRRLFAALREAFAFEAQYLAAIGVRRDGQADRARQSRNLHTAPENRLLERYRKFQTQILPVARKMWVRGKVYRDQHVAGRAAVPTLAPLAAQADLLPVFNRRRDADFELLSACQLEAPRAAAHSLFERDRGGKANIFAFDRTRAPMAPPSGTARKPAENVGKYVFGTEGPGFGGPEVESSREALKPAGLKSAEALRPRIETARLARSVYFSAVILRALFLVADHLIGRVDFLEALRLFRVVAMRIGMKFLRKRAEGSLDVRL